MVWTVPTGSSTVLLTRFKDFIFHVSSDAVGILLTVQEAVLGVAQGAGGDISGTAGATRVRSRRPVSKISLSAITPAQTDHLLLASGCRLTAGCSTSVLTSRVGNARPSPGLEGTVRFLKMRAHFKDLLVTEGMAALLCLLPGEHRQEPVLPLVSKHLCDILLKTQREAVLVGASSEDWRPEGLCRDRPITGCIKHLNLPIDQ